MEGGYSDELIVEQIMSGQKDLFRLLVRHYQGPIYGMGLSFFRNTEDASDFTQEVFLKVYRGLSCFERRSRFSTWLYKIAYNTAINGVNRRKDAYCEQYGYGEQYVSLASLQADWQAEGGIFPKPVDDDTPERQMIRTAARDAIQASVRELPERYRICIDMFFFYGCSYSEIEAITGFPVNTIKSHVFRAKKLLRESLKELV